MVPESAGRSRRVLAAAGVSGLLLLLLVPLFIGYARQYFFLFDDFALVEMARTHSIVELLVDPLIGYYRPLPFVVLRLESLLFGWDHPAAYLSINLLFHLANAGLCAYLTFMLAPRMPAAVPIAFVLVLASPWATEASFWASGVFDVLATFGALVSLIGFRLTLGAETRTRRLAGVALAGAGALFAVFSKESAVVIPAVAVAVGLVDRPLKALFRGMTLLALAACSVPVFLYLVARAMVLGLLAGAYGDFGTLWGHASIADNIYSFARALVWIPVRPAWPPYALALTILLRQAFVFLLLPIVVVALAMARPRLLAGCVGAFLLATLPVCWFGLSADSTVAGRYAYLPAIFGAVALAVGLACTLDLLSRTFWTVAGLVLLAVALAYVGASCLYQSEMWASACTMSRGVLSQVERYRGRRDLALEIQNMPFMFVEGPYVLKAYAFRLYRDDREPALPPIKAYGWTVKFAWNGQTITPTGIDPTSDFLDGAPNGLPVESIRLRLTP